MDTNCNKLKTNLKLAINRLKLLQKKKAELTQKARKEIADSISAGKIERAKIRVEYIIREDYLIEALEIVEMFCDILLSRFGLIQQLKTLDPSIAEAVSSMLWVSPQLFTDVSEMKVISEQLTLKYGKKYTEACRLAAVDTISEKLKHKLNIQAPPKLLVEHYLIEIAKTYNIEYTPDPQVMKEEEQAKGLDALLFDGLSNNLSDNAYPRPPGFVGYPQPPQMPTMPHPYQPFNYPQFPQPPTAPGGMPTGPHETNVKPEVIPPAALSYNIPPSFGEPVHNDNAVKPINVQPSPSYKPASAPPSNNASQFADKNKQSNIFPKPAPRAKMPPSDLLPELPAVPSDDILPDVGNTDNNYSTYHDDNEIDFDDITRRFEELKKKQ